MPVRGYVLSLAFVLLCSAVAHGATPAPAPAPPKIGKPRPAPPFRSIISTPPPAAIDNALTVGGDEVKARRVDTRLSVDVHVNGRGPYRFLVDSGADTSAVGVGVARELALPLGRPAILSGMTARNLVDRVKVDELTLGPSTIRDLELPALREGDLGGDGLIGIDALVQQRLMMDFEKSLIKVEDARQRVRHFPGEIVVTGRRRRGQLIVTEVRASGVRLDAIIDTGSELTIGNLALRDKLIRRHRDRFWDVEAIGVTGVTAKLELVRIDELRVGPIVMHDVPIAFGDVPPFGVFGLSDTPALLIGTDILAAFRRVSLDFRARKVRFQLRRCKPEAVVLNQAPLIARLSVTDIEACRR